MMKRSGPSDHPQETTGVRGLRRLADFRYQLRKFLRFSERAARSNGLTPQQHQLLLGIAGFTGRGWATIGELAEFLQERHNAVVGLVQRAERHGLVRKSRSDRDHRIVQVHILPEGERLLNKLTELHRAEIRKLRLGTPNLKDLLAGHD